jgi:plastocyanin
MDMAKKQKRKPKRGKLGGNVVLIGGGIALLAAVAAFAWMAFDGGADPPRRRVRQTPVVTDEMRVSIEVVDNDYVARDITVPVGAEVTWDFTGDLPHTVTDERGTFDSGTLGDGDSYVLTFADPGKHYYYCTLHHAMQGTITVGEGEPTATPDAATPDAATP